VRRVPYRLPELIEAIAAGHPVFVAEGEKDCDALWSLGIPSTCNPQGAGKWRNGFSEHFSGASVYILPDNDEPGRAHAEQVLTSLTGAGAAARILQLPGLPDKGDVSDWLKSGGTAEQLYQLAQEAPQQQEQPTGWRSNVICASDLQYKTFPRLAEVVPKLIVEGLTILAGRPKVGKSWKALDLSLGVAGSHPVLGGITPMSGDVLYCALEDTQRRLQSRATRLIGYADPWPSRLHLATNWRRLDEGGIEDIAAWADSVDNPRMVVLDTLAGARPQRNSGEQLYDSDYKALVGLQKFAGERHLAALVLHHTRKMEADDPLDTVSGTLGLTGCADTVMVIHRTSQGTTLYVRGRDIEEAEHAIVFDKATCRWSVMGDANEVYLSDANKKILEVLLAASGPMRADVIASLIKAPRDKVDVYLGRLVHSGQVIRSGRGEYIHAERADLMQKGKAKK
jgi:hypothetical protein